MGYKIIGKDLYLDGNRVNLEVGNTEQIKFLKRHSEMLEFFNGSGIELNVDVEKQTFISTRFQCICGEGYVYVEHDGDEYDDEDSLVGMKPSCKICKQQYEIETNNDNNIVAKILNEKK